jgi:hypothetical protein
MKLKMLLVANVGLSLALGAGFIGCKRQQQPVRFDTADSPIDMGGGSIYACSQAGWTTVHGQNYDYTAQSSNPDIDQIFTNGMINLSSPLPTTLPGWVIKFSNTDQVNSKKQGAVTISSDPDPACFSQAGCSNPGIGDHKTVYLGCRPQDCKWIQQNGQSLHFHDKTCDSPGHSGEDKRCDHLVDVTFQFQNQTVTADCAGGVCSIGIGAKIPTKCVPY